ncbi:hypothetical protein OAG73_00775 [bacterium]|nr:hypothetical protein [bacterium]
MNLVLTMAGKYEQNKLFGNKVPKYLMPLGKATVLWHVIEEFVKTGIDLKVFLLANHRDREFFPILKAIMDDFYIPTKNLTYLSDTASQLETASKISVAFEDKIVTKDRPIAFGNIDTIVKNRRYFFDKLETMDSESGLIDVFSGNSQGYSYILSSSDNDDAVLDITDHHRLSKSACSGLYGFGSARFFYAKCREYLKKNKSTNFTECYRFLLNEKVPINYAKSYDLRDTIVVGTPEEYIINLHRFN